MMKILLAVIAIVFVSFLPRQTNNPLRNTKWETPNGLLLYFTPSDSVKMIMQNKVLNVAQYKVKDSLITWRDFVKSEATCDTSIRGTYIYHIRDSLLSFKVLSDRCELRADVMQTLVLARE
jgi:hypothetical protein